jgi:hypothetical protein
VDHLGRLPSQGGRCEHRTLSQATVAALAADVHPWLRHVHEPATYCVVGRDAAEIVGVTRATLTRLTEMDRVPFVRHRDGTRLYRRAQLETVAKGLPIINTLCFWSG